MNTNALSDADQALHDVENEQRRRHNMRLIADCERMKKRDEMFSELLDALDNVATGIRYCGGTTSLSFDWLRIRARGLLTEAEKK